MAICKSATRFDKDSYYETIVNEETEDVMVRGTKNGDSVEYSLGGGGGSPLVINIDPETYTLDKTWSEINDAFPNIYAKVELTGGVEMKYASLNIAHTDYYRVVFFMEGQKSFKTDTPDGYPVMEQ